MRKGLIATFCLVMFLVFVATACTQDDSYNYISPAEFKERLGAGEVEQGSLVVFSTQTEEEWESGHLPQAIPTFARPLETDEDYAKMDPVLDKVRGTDADIVIICPRGGGGATRPFDYFEEQGIDTARMLILEGGQEAYNDEFPGDVVFQ